MAGNERLDMILDAIDMSMAFGLVGGEFSAGNVWNGVRSQCLQRSSDGEAAGSSPCLERLDGTRKLGGLLCVGRK